MFKRSKKVEIQPNLFAEQLTLEEMENKRTAAIAFELFCPNIPKWHQLQDAPNSTSGNCYFWWQSRYSEWLHEKIKEFERRSKFDKAFRDVWLDYETRMTRSPVAFGLPDKAI